MISNISDIDICNISVEYTMRVVHVLRVDPCAAPRMVRSDKWKRRKCVVKYFNFKDQVKFACNSANYQLGDILNICFIIPMPASWNAKKREKMMFQPHKQKPDRDNLLKAFQDAFGGDDSFIYDGRTLKIWGNEGAILICV